MLFLPLVKISKMTKVAVLIPDRGDRKEFMDNCLRQLANQTLKPVRTQIMGAPPTSSACDITKRYRKGYEALSNSDIDLILFMENDDWYSTDYVETMVKYWRSAGRPQLFGINYRIFYNLRTSSWYKAQSHAQSIGATTAIVPRLNIDWPADDYPNTDTHLWKYGGLESKLFCPPKHLHIGMKHGIGKCGTPSHTQRLHQFTETSSILKETLDKESLNFFLQMHLRVVEKAVV